MTTSIPDFSLDGANEPAWYALYTRHHHEQTVARTLASKGFETLLPLQKTTRQWKDRVQPLSLPLFPCYVFLKGGLDRRLDVMKTPGVHALLSSGGQPAAIPPIEIEAIRRVMESGVSAEPYPYLNCGDTVRVKYGPLAGIQGILVRKKNIYRLVLCVEMLGKAAAVEVDGLLVERVQNHPPLVLAPEQKPLLVGRGADFSTGRLGRVS